MGNRVYDIYNILEIIFFCIDVFRYENLRNYLLMSRIDSFSLVILIHYESVFQSVTKKINKVLAHFIIHCYYRTILHYEHKKIKENN